MSRNNNYPCEGREKRLNADTVTLYLTNALSYITRIIGITLLFSQDFGLTHTLYDIVKLLQKPFLYRFQAKLI